MEPTHGHEGETKAGARKHIGGCHCGAVRYEVEVDLGRGASRCNCTICTKTAVTGCIVKPDAFRLLSGEPSLSTYRWGGNISTRFFCKHCGVHCFGKGFLAEVGGDYVSINANTLDEVDPNELTIVHFDGRHNNWESGPRSTPWPISTRATT